MTRRRSSTYGRWFGEKLRGLGRSRVPPGRCLSCLPVEGLSGFSFKNQLRVLSSEKPFPIPPHGAYITPCAFSSFASITRSGLCLSLLDEEVLDGKTMAWSFLCPHTWHSWVSFTDLFYENVSMVFCVPSPGFGTPGSMVSRAHVVPDPWSVVWRGQLLWKAHSFIHSFIQQHEALGL